MSIFYTKMDLFSFLESKEMQDLTLGLVPTMGALHKGHLSLIKKALSENDKVVVSIFVNPTQFNNPNDLEKYPRNLDHDLALLRKVDPNILVFAPSANDIYEGSVVSQNYNFDGLDKAMEGAFRPGHFDGVGTIVELFLKTVSPDKAYFGEKDFQQLQIIRKLVKKRGIKVEIIGCPIEREPNGLAMSSRNERLSIEMRQKAGFIYKTLETAKKKFGTESANHLLNWVGSEFEKNEDFELEYFSISEEETLLPIKRKENNKEYRAFIAVYANDVRLIDNLKLN
ncbi:pantoate--beta-alanine ligase [Flagellimonas meridianipacifica]|uniref:Pantothenate synthetase n=1 Tax=Flagellimonas meridianipacifica TaxID=1080225 RepID=A0A2T0MGE7_9FLAO|nr:pantoate--beta-alanine ligase [Allomuricauda pacifica]PRX56635.1 pantoate--beta-alanine ligase [Allomuricauda pacifica]